MNRTLAVTLSPRNRVDKYNTLKWIFQNDASEIALLFRKCSKNYQIYPEFDINGRLHYHGIASIHDLIKWHKHTKPGLDKIGYTLIKEIKHDKKYDLNKNNWLKYCTKEWDITRKVLSIEHEIQWTKRPINKHELYDEKNRFIGYGFGYEKSDELKFISSEDLSSDELCSISSEDSSIEYLIKHEYSTDTSNLDQILCNNKKA